jgi:hypothetical protein
LTLDEELTDELDTSFLLLEESPDFTELELLESDEFFVSFAELLDTSAGSEPLTLLEDLSFSVDSFPDDFLSTEDDDSSVESESFTLEDDSTADVSLLSPLADDESSQPTTSPRQNTDRATNTLNFFIGHPHTKSLP